MAHRGTAITITYVAWDTQNNVGKTGDAANHTLRWIKDGVAAAPANSPAQVDATNAPGVYKLQLSAAECTCNFGVLAGKSSTAGVVIMPVSVSFDDPLLNSEAVGKVKQALGSVGFLYTYVYTEDSDSQFVIEASSMPFTPDGSNNWGHGWMLVMTSGAYAGQMRTVTEIVPIGSGQYRVVVDGQFPGTPAAYDELVIIPSTFDTLALTQTQGLNTYNLLTSLAISFGTLTGKFTGITSVANWLRGLFRSDPMDATAKSEVNNGGGTYNEATDSAQGSTDTLAERTLPPASAGKLDDMLDGTGGVTLRLRQVDLQNADGSPVLITGSNGSQAAITISQTQGQSAVYFDTSGPAIETDVQGDLSAAIAAASVSAASVLAKLSGITSLANWLRGLFRKDTMDPTAKAEVNLGGGTYDEATASLQGLELATGNVQVLPPQAVLTPGVIHDAQAMVAYQHARVQATIAVFDAQKNPIDLTGHNLSLVAYATSAPTVVVMELKNYGGDTDLVVGGANNNQVAVDGPDTDTPDPGTYRFVLRDMTTDSVLAAGPMKVVAAADATAVP